MTVQKVPLTDDAVRNLRLLSHIGYAEVFRCLEIGGPERRRAEQLSKALDVLDQLCDLHDGGVGGDDVDSLMSIRVDREQDGRICTVTEVHARAITALEAGWATGMLVAASERLAKLIAKKLGRATRDAAAVKLGYQNGFAIETERGFEVGGEPSVTASREI